MEFKEWFMLEAAASGMMDLYHYSNAEPDAKGTLTLDPNKFKTDRHSYTQREYQISSVPRIFFYASPNDVKKDFGPGMSRYLYKTSVPANSIYSISKDPLKLYDKMMKMNKNAESITLLLSLVKKAGYRGILYGGNAEYPPRVVSWFDKITVKLVKDLYQ